MISRRVFGRTASREGEPIRYGGRIGDSGYYRVYARNSGSNALTDSAGHPAADSSGLFHTGMRADWKSSREDELSPWDDIYAGSEGQTVAGLLSITPPVTGSFNDRTSILGGNLQGRWHRASPDRFDTTVLAYFTGEDRKGVLDFDRDTIAAEVVQHLAVSRHDLIWGGVFLQDEIAMVRDRVWLTLGSKLEHNAYSGFALQPNVRLLWIFRPHQTFWRANSQQRKRLCGPQRDERSGIGFREPCTSSGRSCSF